MRLRSGRYSDEILLQFSPNCAMPFFNRASSSELHRLCGAGGRRVAVEKAKAWKIGMLDQPTAPPRQTHCDTSLTGIYLDIMVYHHTKPWDWESGNLGI